MGLGWTTVFQNTNLVNLETGDDAGHSVAKHYIL